MEMQGQPIYASDANEALIFMWQKLQRGWQPPDVVTEAEYQRAKRGEYDAALTAFVLIGCAFSGNWGHGYARDKYGKNYAGVTKRGLAQKLAQMDSPFFFTSDFLQGYPPDYGCLIYCDPPYAGVSGYSGPGLEPFDHARFWERVRQLEALGHTVVVSEYQAPDDFECVLEMPTRMSMRTKDGSQEKRVERLFRWRVTSRPC